MQNVGTPCEYLQYRGKFYHRILKNTCAIMVVQLLLQNENTFLKDYSSTIAVRQEG